MSWRDAHRYDPDDPSDRLVLNDLERRLAALFVLDTPAWLFDAERCQALWANRAGLEIWRAPTVASLQRRDVASTQSDAVHALLNDYLRRVEAGEHIAVWVTLAPQGTTRRSYQSHHSFTLADGRKALLIEARMEPPAEEQLAAASNHALTIGLYDLDGRLLSGNPAFGALGARQSLDSLDALLPPDGSLADWAARLERQSIVELEADLETERGRRWFRGELRRVVDHDRAERAMLLLFDVTEQRLIEAERARASAEAATEAKSLFLANMSHEIRTPLNAIIGFTHLCLRAELPPKPREYVLKTQAAAKNLLGIVNDILDFSKIEAGAMSLEVAPFELEAALALVDSIVGQSARAKGVALRFDVAEDVPRVLLGDALRLGQVLLNLAGNAVKFTAAGTVSVAVTLEQGDPSSVTLRFTVRDTGVGMSLEQQGRLFQAFSQADPSMTRKYGGTGLGLVISSRLVALMDGHISVESEPGLGSAFSFTARFRRGVPAQPAPPSTDDAAVAAIAKLAGARVLVVEDNEFNRQVIVELLQSAGVEATVAHDGVQGLACLSRQRFDLVLMDVQMPNMDGYEATRRVRATTALAAMPILAMTANARLEDRAHCRAAGMDDVVTKPIAPDRLYVTMARWLGARGAHGPGGPPAPEPAPPSAAPASAGANGRGELDLSLLRRSMRNNQANIARLLRLFLENARQTMDAIDAAHERGDLIEIARLGHRLKSSAGTVGAAQLAEACARLEDAGKRGDAAAVQALLAPLAGAMTRAEAAIDAELSAAAT